MINKLMPLDKAVLNYVKDRDFLLFGGFPMSRYPNVFCKEILRQRKKGNIHLNDLTLIGPSTNVGGDLLVAEGIVDAIFATFSSHERAGISKVVRKSLEHGLPRKVKWEDESNLTINLKLMAGALNIPFIPSSSGLWGDLNKPGLWDQKHAYPKNIVMEDPYGSGKKMALLQALRPDIAVMHVPFADIRGNGIMLGSLYFDYWASKAGKEIILVADQIVDNAMCRQYPNLVTVPGVAVSAVIPWYMGAWPCNSIGHYGEDLTHLSNFIKDSSDEDALKAYMDKYVYSWETHEEYMELIGLENIKKLESNPSKILGDPFREWVFSKEKVEGLLKESKM